MHYKSHALNDTPEKYIPTHKQSQPTIPENVFALMNKDCVLLFHQTMLLQAFYQNVKESRNQSGEL